MDFDAHLISSKQCLFTSNHRKIQRSSLAPTPGSQSLTAWIPISMPNIQTLPVELHQAILAYLPVPGLLSAYRVNASWRSLAPKGATPNRLHLFSLAFRPHKCHLYPHPVNLATRLSYVEYIETKYSVRIPEEYRVVLTEWPISIPPSGMHWPHALRFFDDPKKGCTCHTPNGLCFCKQAGCHPKSITIRTSLLHRVHAGEDFNVTAQRWELYKGPTFHAPEARAQTLRLLNSYRELVDISGRDEDSEEDIPRQVGVWQIRGEVSDLTLLVLDMSTCITQFVDPDDGLRKAFIDRSLMILNGEARGQIHMWSRARWYHGFQAETFLEWRIEELTEEQLRVYRHLSRPACYVL
ncbi:hypothetical protein JAAARDRAFT_413387 [Jaapia argillacea MUCL 33604]|uniref:F-box domain-containing protein n=1 Tax=Jaapia argillacea MUCL 33604 TaxID=933084 RepID=A0A067PH90_9AGAM|nr:hypothetical protein JAAARDRAFT_413387 [Jaapia argillacea MUCL 33604]